MKNKSLFLTLLLALSGAMPIHAVVQKSPEHNLYDLIAPIALTMAASWGDKQKTYSDMAYSVVRNTALSQTALAVGDLYFTPKQWSIQKQLERSLCKGIDSVITSSCGYGVQCLLSGLKTNPTDPSFWLDTAVPFTVQIAAAVLLSDRVEGAYKSWKKWMFTTPRALPNDGHVHHGFSVDEINALRKRQGRKPVGRVKAGVPPRCVKPAIQHTREPAERLLERAA